MTRKTQPFNLDFILKNLANFDEKHGAPALAKQWDCDEKSATRRRRDLMECLNKSKLNLW